MVVTQIPQNQVHTVKTTIRISVINPNLLVITFDVGMESLHACAELPLQANVALCRGDHPQSQSAHSQDAGTVWQLGPEAFFECLGGSVFFWWRDPVHETGSIASKLMIKTTLKPGKSEDGCKMFQVGKSLPVVVTVSLPCFTPLAVINSSAILRITAALPRTSNTSRQLW